MIPLKVYTPEFTKNFNDQWEKVPEGSELDIYITDSMNLKDAVKACQGKR